ncbi:molybdopterin-dependent oxidoreductase [Candidatus Nitrospira allomarina]|uniref:Molybdopterin-dependent oxidoreductase n=1 Tax=Candidatus Nitrospira allomarina TaxID=3020900 RepID=A0AA96GFN2_9BACT|nr:molybdopterin-dependent oxidoreductase [Candidatus Nitrospira allomarina]WNM59210.1 molybdopterin-dependent oxidoreductase [Candidatus Nitrospira allomarina]
MGLKPVTTPDVEAATIELTLDGEVVQAKEGVSLYDVISSTGKIVPAMCYHYTFDPFGSCGMCLVFQEGKKAPVRSCTAKAAAGMVIQTEGEDLFLARKKAVEKHLSVHPLDCPVCDADGHCELQDMAFEHGVTNLANAKQKNIPEDTRSLVLDFNMNRCIACGECINICKDVLRIDALQFMKKGGFTQVVAKGDQALDCEFCGDCLAVCPVGAITNKFSKYAYKPWQLKKTTTTCNYCGDGCQIYVETKDTEVVRVTSPLSWKNKWGDRTDTVNGHDGICVRGRFGFQFIDSDTRLKTPLVRTESGLQPSPWLDALDLAAGRLANVKAQYGAQAIAGLITARCTNEDLYVFQKFMRSVIGTNHLDSSARYGHLNFVRAMKHALGLHRMMNTSEEINKAKAVLIIGANITETNPVASLRVKSAMGLYKAQTIVVDSMQTNIAKLASHPMMVKPGTEGLFVQGLVKSVLDQDLIDEEATSAFPEALHALRQAVGLLSLEDMASRTGVGLEQIHEAARIFAEASRSIIICGEGILRHAGGYQHMLNLIDLAWITGKLGRKGCGINTYTEEANEQGAVDMGVAPEYLPGPVSFTDSQARETFARVWGNNLPDVDRGANLTEILDRCQKGEIKALYLVGENPLETLPVSYDVTSALAKLEVLICQDPFLTEIAKMAHVVFPASTFAEKDGTVTNQEGKVQFLRPALDSLGESTLDWHIMVGMANGLGSPMEYETTQDIQNEIRKVLPGYYNLGKVSHVAPAPSEYFSKAFSEEVALRYPVGMKSPTQRPFALRMIQLIYHSGKLSTRASGLMEISPNTSRLCMSTQDFNNLGLGVHDRVRVTSDQGTVEMGVEEDTSLLPGTCTVPEHFNDPPVKDLMSVQVDPVTGVPYFKLTYVSIEKA